MIPLIIAIIILIFVAIESYVSNVMKILVKSDAAIDKGGKYVESHNSEIASSLAELVGESTAIDTEETARNAFGVETLKVVDRKSYTPAEFEAANIHNHRAELGKTLDEIFPEDDRPRGDRDISSVKYHMGLNKLSPIVLLQREGKPTVVLDGVHRIVAAYLSDKTIDAIICEPA